MLKIYFSEQSIEQISAYIRGYRELFEALYSDTGIWSEDQIVQQYIKESETRRDEIFQIIENHLSLIEVLGRRAESSIYLPWRTKILSIRWEDENESRIITQIKIR